MFISVARDAIAGPIETIAVVEVAPIARDGVAEPVKTSVVVPSKCRTGYCCHHNCDYQRNQKEAPQMLPPLL